MMKLHSQRSYIALTNRTLTSKDFPEVTLFDQIITDGEIELKLLRKLLTDFQQRPSGDLRLLVINNAEKLSEAAQNTLLKTLEEPPTKAAVVLQLNSIDALLPTLRSRLQRLDWTQSLTETELRPIKLSDLYSSDRSVVVENLEQALKTLDLTSSTGLKKHNLLTRAIRRLNQSANLKLTLDWLDLNWEADSGTK